MQLTGKQTQYLRALAHPLKPLVQVGNKGISDTLIQQISEQLVAHELIKVRFNTESVDPSEVMDAVVERTDSQLVQKLGRTLVLYKRHEDNPKVELPGKVRKAQIVDGARGAQRRARPSTGSEQRRGKPGADRRRGKPSEGPTRRDGKLSAGAGRRAPKASAAPARRVRQKKVSERREPVAKAAPPPERKVGATTSYQRRLSKATSQAAKSPLRAAPLKRPGRSAQNARSSAHEARSAAPLGTRTRVRRPPRTTQGDDS